MSTRLGQLEQWKIVEDASRAAIEKYKAEEAQKAQQRAETSESKSKAEVMKQVGYILGLVGVAMYAFLASKGIFS